PQTESWVASPLECTRNSKRKAPLVTNTLIIYHALTSTVLGRRYVFPYFVRVTFQKSDDDDISRLAWYSGNFPFFGKTRLRLLNSRKCPLSGPGLVLLRGRLGPCQPRFSHPTSNGLPNSGSGTSTTFYNLLNSKMLTGNQLRCLGCKKR